MTWYVSSHDMRTFFNTSVLAPPPSERGLCEGGINHFPRVHGLTVTMSDFWLGPVHCLTVLAHACKIVMRTHNRYILSDTAYFGSHPRTTPSHVSLASNDTSSEIILSDYAVRACTRTSYRSVLSDVRDRGHVRPVQVMIPVFWRGMILSTSRRSASKPHKWWSNASLNATGPDEHSGASIC